MKVSDVPQDLNYYKDTVVRDLNYAVDEQGRYQAVVSDGWEPKDDALDLAWDDIREQCDEVLERSRHVRDNLTVIEQEKFKGKAGVVNEHISGRGGSSRKDEPKRS